MKYQHKLFITGMTLILAIFGFGSLLISPIMGLPIGIGIGILWWKEMNIFIDTYVIKTRK